MHDADLRRALRRREPPDGFADRVLDRIRAEEARRNRRTPAPAPSRPRRWVAAALAVAATVLVSVGVAREEAARRDAEARVAARNLEVALQIASETLQHVQTTVNQIGEGHDDHPPSR